MPLDYITLVDSNKDTFNQNISYNPTYQYWDTSAVDLSSNMTAMFSNAISFNNGQYIGNTTSPMNWTISFSGTPANFSTGSALTSQNAPTFY